MHKKPDKVWIDIIENSFISKILDLGSEEYIWEGNFEDNRNNLIIELNEILSSYKMKLRKVKLPNSPEQKTIKIINERIKGLSAWIKKLKEVDLDLDWEEISSSIGPWGGEEEAYGDIVDELVSCADD